MNAPLRALVFGAGGMAGGEVLRLLAGHPSIRAEWVVSRSRAGSPLWNVHPHLRASFPDLAFITPDEASDLAPDIVFLALPHGASFPWIRRFLDRGVKVADLSADVRLSDMKAHERWYGAAHPDPELATQRVYGLPELHRDALAGASLASGVGCNATCAILGLFPLARAGLVEDVRMELRVGSSEGGAEPSQGGHHPYRTNVLRVIEPFRHRHLAEVIQETGIPEERLLMTVTAVPVVRGVQMFAQVTLSKKCRESEIWSAYRKAFEGQPFLSLCPARPAHLRFPDPRLVLGSNRCMVGFALEGDGRRLVLVSAIDNLMKGAAGSAVQCANIMLGLGETEGLAMIPVYPA